MKIRVVRVSTSKVANRRRRLMCTVSLFLGTVVIRFLLHLSTYETLSFAELLDTISNMPRRWNRRPSEYQLPSFNWEEILSNKSSGKDDMHPNFFEESTLLNLDPFSWEMHNQSLCAPDPAYPKYTRILPVLIFTARNHFVERLAIRRSWGSVPLYKKWDVRLVFLLGQQDRASKPKVNEEEHEKLDKRLTDEQHKFGDLVMGNFIDTYHNLTYKHMMGYKWILNFCRNATFVLKFDNDLFIDILRWLDWRSTDLDVKEEDKTFKIPDLYCNFLTNTKPRRRKTHKWYASVEDWPTENFPDYCSGAGHGLTLDLIEKLYSVSQDVKFLWLDDVFVTGVLREAMTKKFGWTPELKHIGGQVTQGTWAFRPMCDRQDWNAIRRFHAMVFVPRGKLFVRDMMCMWNKTLHDSTYKWSLVRKK